jgi:hypothetical protein
MDSVDFPSLSKGSMAQKYILCDAIKNWLDDAM